MCVCVCVRVRVWVGVCVGVCVGVWVCGCACVQREEDTYPHQCISKEERESKKRGKLERIVAHDYEGAAEDRENAHSLFTSHARTRTVGRMSGLS